MKKAAGGHPRPIRLDSVVEVPGGLVGTDPYRGWGPTIRWTMVLLRLPIVVRQRPFNKRDVVVTDPSRTREFYREGTFSSWAADRRKMAIATTIKTEGLDQFLRRMQIEQSTIGPVSAPSGRVSGLQEARISMRLWEDRLGGGIKRSWNRRRGNREH
jgi:hypothetical protein